MAVDFLKESQDIVAANQNSSPAVIGSNAFNFTPNNLAVPAPATPTGGMTAVPGGMTAANMTVAPPKTPTPANLPLPTTPKPAPTPTPEDPGQFFAPGTVTPEKAEDAVKSAEEVEKKITPLNPSQMTPEQRKGMPGYDKDGYPIYSTGNKFDVFGNLVQEGARFTEPKSTDQTKVDQATADYNNELKEYGSKLDEMKAIGDSRFNAQIDSIKRTFAGRIAQMETINKNTLGAQKLLGARAGRTRYAGEIQQGIISNEERAGIARIGELEQQMNEAILNASIAKDAKDMEMFTKQMEVAEKSYNAKRQATLDMAALTKQKNDELRAQAEASRADQKWIAEQSEKMADILSGSLLTVDAEGNVVTPDIDVITKQADDYGIDPNYLIAGIKKKGSELAKMTQEEIQREVNINKTIQDMAMAGMSEKQKAWKYMVDNEGYDKGFFTYLQEEANSSESELDRRKKSLDIEKLEKEAEGGGFSKEEMDLRKEFASQPEVKSYSDISRSYQAMSSAWKEAQKKSANKESKAAADQALITLYNKMLDPTSVVREGEYARSEQGQSAINRATAAYNQVAYGGAKLTDATRKDLVDIAERLYDDSKKTYDSTADYYKGLATDYGLNPERVVKSIDPTIYKPVNYTDELGKLFQKDKNILIKAEDMVKDGYSDEEIYQILKGSSFSPSSTSEPPFNTGAAGTPKGGYVSSVGSITGYGSPYWKWGLDIDLKKGDPLTTPVGGEVVWAGPKGNFGNQVAIKTPKGNIVMLSHLDKVNVKKGQKVSAGMNVGLGGNTGKVIASGGGDGSHLDLTIKKPDGSYYSPKEIATKLS